MHYTFAITCKQHESNQYDHNWLKVLALIVLQVLCHGVMDVLDQDIQVFTQELQDIFSGLKTIQKKAVTVKTDTKIKIYIYLSSPKYLKNIINYF